MDKILKKTAFASCLLILFAIGSAQATPIPYAVDDYIPVLFEDQQLYVSGEVRFDGSGSSFSNDSAGGYFGLSTNSDYDYDNLRLRGQGQYIRRYTTVAKWYDFNTYLSTEFSTRKNSSNREDIYSLTSSYRYEDESKRKNFRPYISPSIDAGTYVSGDFMVSGRASMSYDYDKESSDEYTDFSENINIIGNTATRTSNFEESDNPSTTKRFYLSAELLFGHGRMYDGVFAFTAISMIEQLDSKGLLLKTPTEGEMRELTEIIYQGRLTHAIDYRLRQIEILDEIISFLHAKGIADCEKVSTTPILYDVWDYFPNDPHYFGLRIRGGFGFMRQTSKSDHDYEYTDRFLEETYDINSPSVVTVITDDTQTGNGSSEQYYVQTMPYFTVLIEKSKPINNRMQLDLMAQGWTYFSDKDSSGTSYIDYVDGVFDDSGSYSYSYERESYTRFLLYGSFRYTFDYRTYAYISATYDRHDFDLKDIIADETMERGGYYLNLNCNVVRRITIPTTIYGRLSYYKSTLSLSPGSIGDYSSDSYSFELGVQHHIF